MLHHLAAVQVTSSISDECGGGGGGGAQTHASAVSKYLIHGKDVGSVGQRQTVSAGLLYQVSTVIKNNCEMNQMYFNAYP